MHGTRKLPDLIEEIYDAALEPALWNDVVVSINDFIGSRACGLISKDTMSQFVLTHHYCGVDHHYIQLYADTHSRFDPLTTLPSLGQVVSIPDLVRYDEYRRGPFYQEWLRPQGNRSQAIRSRDICRHAGWSQRRNIPRRCRLPDNACQCGRR